VTPQAALFLRQPLPAGHVPRRVGSGRREKGGCVGRFGWRCKGRPSSAGQGYGRQEKAK
jgi:hypothetical protein